MESASTETRVIKKLTGADLHAAYKSAEGEWLGQIVLFNDASKNLGWQPALVDSVDHDAVSVTGAILLNLRPHNPYGEGWAGMLSRKIPKGDLPGCWKPGPVYAAIQKMRDELTTLGLDVKSLRSMTAKHGYSK